jgi:hypothetical protein
MLEYSLIITEIFLSDHDLLMQYKLEDEVQKAKGTTLQPPKGKSPMTIRISSLKTNPTIVNNSLTDDESLPGTAKPVLKIKKPKSLLKPDGTAAESSSDEAKKDEEVKTKPVDIPEPIKGGSGILANALGQPRMTRRMSNSSVGQEQSLEKQRLTRSQIQTPPSAGGSEEEAETQAANVGIEEDRRTPAEFLENLGLRKTSDLIKPTIKIKEEPEDSINEDEGEHTTTFNKRPAGGFKQDLLNKSGAMRYSLSKDISISAVDDPSEGVGGKTNVVRMMNKSPMVQMAGGGKPSANRMPPGLIPQAGGNRPRISNTNGGGGSNVVNAQRMMGQSQNPNQRLTRPVRPGGVMPMRPGVRMK